MDSKFINILRISLLASFVFGSSSAQNQVNEDCGLNGYEAHCVLDIMDEHIEATAIVNHCHIPLDITFRVIYRYGNGTEQRWQYTFVTTNQNERVLIPGLILPPAPYALVYLYVRIPQDLFDLHNSSLAAVEASFVAILSDDTWEEVEFLNEVITIDTIEDCFLRKGNNDDHIIWIIGGVFLGLLFIGATTTGVLWWYRKKKIAIDELALVSSLETGLPGAQPYQIGSTDQNCINNNVLKECPEINQKGNTEKNINSNDPSRVKSSSFGFNRLNEESADKVREKMSKKLGKAVVIGNPVLVDKTSFFKNQFNRLSPVNPEGAKSVKKVEAVGDAFENSYSVEESLGNGKKDIGTTKLKPPQVPDDGIECTEIISHIRCDGNSPGNKTDAASIGARPKDNKPQPADSNAKCSTGNGKNHSSEERNSPNIREHEI